MAGLLDVFDTIGGQQALGLLAAAGPRSDGAGFGQRLQEGLGAADVWKMRQAKMAQEAQQAEFQKMQMDAYKNKLLQEKQIQDAMRAKSAALPGLFASPVSSGSISVPEVGRVPMFGGGVNVERASTVGAPRLDVQRALSAGYSPKEIQELDALRNVGLDEVARTVDVEGANGGKTVRGLDKFGRPVFDQNGYVAPVSVSQGDRTTFVKPAAGVSLPMNMSPTDRDASARGWAGNALANQRLQFDMNGGMDGGGATQMGLNKQFGKPQAGYRWKADGSMEFIPGGPADQKSQLKTSGEGTVDSVVADLRDKYDKLNTGGGIVNDKEGMFGNIGARIASTGIGQTLGGAVGTTNQTSRDNIAMTRPLLLQSIMKATGMSSKQMDSNAELKLYLATATDPTKGYQANMEALQRIEDLYGSGQKGAKQTDKPAAPISSIPQGAIGRLKMQPALREAFDAKYGAGAAAQILGN